MEAQTGLKPVAVTLESNELTVISDLLRRAKSGGIFTSKPEFRSALVTIELAKDQSYGWDRDPGEVTEWVEREFPGDPSD